MAFEFISLHTSVQAGLVILLDLKFLVLVETVMEIETVRLFQPVAGFAIFVFVLAAVVEDCQVVQ